MPTDERRWIGSLRPGDKVEELYAVADKELRQRRGGGRFLSLNLCDSSGRLGAMVWENVGELDRVLEPGRVVLVRGNVQRYNQRLQMIVREAQVVAEEQIDERLFVKSSGFDPEALWDQLISLIENLDDDHLKQLLFRVLADPEVSQRLRLAPAARVMHHAYRAGLLEHTVSMATLASKFAGHYGLDRDIIVAGCVLHDLGKIWEFDNDHSLSYTDDGRLIGHLTIGVLYVERVLADLPSFPAETRRQLLHAMLAHHGEYEFGSPRRPKTPEALLIHLLDNLDSRMAGVLDTIATEGEHGDAWTANCRILGRPIYRRRRSDEPNEEPVSPGIEAEES
ncbi:MAG: HD domain-containing protein [bacterium]|nr:HD domain-containing protein [bacterium]